MARVPGVKPAIKPVGVKTLRVAKKAAKPRMMKVQTDFGLVPPEVAVGQ